MFTLSTLRNSPTILYMDDSEIASLKVLSLSMLLALLMVAGCAKHVETSAPLISSSKPKQETATPLSKKGDEVVESTQSESGAPVTISRATNEGALHEPSKREIKAPEINMDELVERLKKTEAIGVFTKLAIRSDVLDFKSSIDTYRKKGELDRYVGHLRDRFDGLLLKILALLERDPALSKDINHARESIWRSFLEATS